MRLMRILVVHNLDLMPLDYASELAIGHNMTNDNIIIDFDALLQYFRSYAFMSYFKNVIAVKIV